MGRVRHSFPGYDDELGTHFFQTQPSMTTSWGQFLPEVIRIDPRMAGPGGGWWRGATPTVTYPYDGPRGDGASCMIRNE